MNTYLTRPDLHEAFGDRLISILNTVSASLDNDGADAGSSDIYPVSSALRTWTRTWLNMHTTSNRDHFQTSLFLERVSEVRDGLKPLSQLIIFLCSKLHHHAVELLGREGTAGDTQCIALITLCTHLLVAGSLMHSAALTLGSDPKLDVEAYMEDVNKQVEVLDRETQVIFKQFDGAFLVLAPTLPLSLAHLRSWVTLFVMSSSVHLAVNTQPQKLITVFMENHPMDTLVQNIQTFIRCVESECVNRDFSDSGSDGGSVSISSDVEEGDDDVFENAFKQQILDTDKKENFVMIGGEMIARDDEHEPWSRLGRIFGPGAKKTTMADTLRRYKWSDKRKGEVKQVTEGRGKRSSNDTINMSNWTMEEWRKYSKDVGITNPNTPDVQRTHLAPWQVSPNVYMGSLIGNIIEAELHGKMAQRDADMRELLKRNNALNVSPEVRQSNESKILNMYESSKKEAIESIQKKLPMHPDKLDKWMKHEMEVNEPMALKVEKANLASRVEREKNEAQRVEEEGGALMHALKTGGGRGGYNLPKTPMDNSAFVEAFTQQLAFTPQRFTQSIYERGSGGQSVLATEEQVERGKLFSKAEAMLSEVAPPKRNESDTWEAWSRRNEATMGDREDEAEIQEGASRPPPLVIAVKDLLGPDPCNALSVVLTSSGPASIPVNVRGLAPFICLCMFIFPVSDTLLASNVFMSHVKKCSQDKVLSNATK